MVSIPDIVNIIKKDLKMKPLDFGFAGELYSARYDWHADQFKIIGKYIFEYQNKCVNRTALFYSTSFSESIALAEQGYDDYCSIYHLHVDDRLKRYVLFSIVEYLINAICKFLNLCFENRNFRLAFYAALKNQLECYMDTLVALMFSATLPEMPPIRDDLYGNIQSFFKDVTAPELREHAESDHKLLLVYAYVLYYDLIGGSQLLLSPLLGAAQIPPFFKSIEKYFSDRFHQNRTITYDYVKYSTYNITDFYSLDEQAAELNQTYGHSSGVLLLDDNIGTGTTVLAIKKVLSNYFSDIKVGAVEYYWSKKIVWNTDAEWFDMNLIDYITPISYRHWLLLSSHIACLKFGAFILIPYVPYMIDEDHHFQSYMSKQNMTVEKKKSMDLLFNKSRLIKEAFYS